MTRDLFQQVAVERLKDAEALLQAGRYVAAYYLSGYAVECALKACIAKRTREGDFPPKNARDYYIHDLARLAGSLPEFEALVAADQAIASNWKFVKDWSEEKRYALAATIGEVQARRMVEAVADAESGILKCLSTVW